MDDTIKPALYPTSAEEHPALKPTVEVGRDHIDLRPHESYEGAHRWDPLAEWTAEEEAKVVRKADFYLLSWLCLMFFGLQLDRGNISNALTDNMLKDLGLNTNDYNNVSCFTQTHIKLHILISCRAQQSNSYAFLEQNFLSNSSSNVTGSNRSFL